MTAPLPSTQSAIGASVKGPRRRPLQTDALCYSRCGTPKNPHYSMAMSTEQRSKFAALESKKFSSGAINPKQTKQIINMFLTNFQHCSHNNPWQSLTNLHNVKITFDIFSSFYSMNCINWCSFIVSRTTLSSWRKRSSSRSILQYSNRFQVLHVHLL